MQSIVTTIKNAAISVFKSGIKAKYQSLIGISPLRTFAVKTQINAIIVDVIYKSVIIYLKTPY